MNNRKREIETKIDSCNPIEVKVGYMDISFFCSSIMSVVGGGDSSSHHKLYFHLLCAHFQMLERK